MSAPDELKDFASHAVCGLSNNPKDVVVTILDSSEGCLCLQASCNASDKGLVIGKQGRNINAIRSLLCSIAAKHAVKVTLVLKE